MQFTYCLKLLQPIKIPSKEGRIAGCWLDFEDDLSLQGFAGCLRFRNLVFSVVLS